MGHTPWTDLIVAHGFFQDAVDLFTAFLFLKEGKL